MSGHSKWSTIKHQKAANDAKKGKIFSKLVKGISLAVKTGGGSSPDSNAKLRVAIEQAKTANMPKNNIDRAIAKAGTDAQNLEEISYEGFGPYGINLIINAATDNKNRTSAELKFLLEKKGGGLGGPGSVSFNFEPKGYIYVKKKKDPDEDSLALIDLGVEDLEVLKDGVEIYTLPSKLFEVKGAVEKEGFEVIEADLIQKPKMLETIDDEAKAKKLLNFFEVLENHDDVQKIFSNVDIPEDVVKKIIG